MEALPAVAVAITAVLSYLFCFCGRTKFSSLPGPTFRQYLPYGEAFPMYKDSSQMLSVVVALCRKYGNTFQVWIGPLDTIVTALPGDIAQILSAGHSFERPPAMRNMFEAAAPHSIMGMDSKRHLEARRHLRLSFNHTHLKDFHHNMSKAVLELCETLARETRVGCESAYQPVNISEHIAMSVYQIITNTAFGWDLNREERLYFAKGTDRLIDEMMREFIGYPLKQLLTIFGSRKQLFEVRQNLRELCYRFVKIRLHESDEQKAQRAPDLLDAIIAMEGGDEERVISQIVVFVVAGTHTTIETIAWAIFEVSRNPLVEEGVQNEINSLLREVPLTKTVNYSDIGRMHYLQCVFTETLRLHPPGPMYLRKALKDVILADSGVLLPAGSHVIALAQISHTNPTIWKTRSDKFMPERWSSCSREGQKAPPGSFVPFSLGQRNCPGRFFAEHEGILILVELYRRFSFTLACNPEQVKTTCGWVADARNRANGKDGRPGLPVFVKRREGV